MIESNEKRISALLGLTARAVLAEIQTPTNQRVRPIGLPRETVNTPAFRKACNLASIPPTRRQMSKYGNERGAAFAFRSAAIVALAEAAAWQ